MSDNLNQLADVLYGRAPLPAEYIGGSEARIFYDAALELTTLREKLAAAEAALHGCCITIEALMAGENRDPCNNDSYCAAMDILLTIYQPDFMNRSVTEAAGIRDPDAFRAAKASLSARGRMLELTNRVQRSYRAAVAAALAELLSTVAGLPVSDYSTDGDGAELVRQDSVIAAVKTAITALGLAEKEQQ